MLPCQPSFSISTPPPGIVEGFGFCDGNAHRTPNNLVGDGVDQNERSFMTTFPYVATPFAGYEAVPPTPMGGP